MVEQPRRGRRLYNQVDTSLGEPDEVRAFLARAGGRLAAAGSADRLLTLALVRWQPLLEIRGRARGADRFSVRGLRRRARPRRRARRARGVLVVVGRPPRGALRFVQSPRLSRHRDALRVEDARARMPGSRVVPLATGASGSASGQVTSSSTRAARRPRDLVLGDRRRQRRRRRRRHTRLSTPRHPAARRSELRGPKRVRAARADRWMDFFGTLAPALANGRALRYLREIVLPATTDTYTIVVRRGEHGGGSTRRRCGTWDLRCAVAGSLLVDVLDARRHWVNCRWKSYSRPAYSSR